MSLPDSQGYPLKLCLIKYELDIYVYNIKKKLFSILVSLQKQFAHFYSREKNKLSESNTYNQKKRQYLPHYRFTKGLTGTVVNRALLFLNGESHEITLTVPLR